MLWYKVMDFPLTNSKGLVRSFVNGFSLLCFTLLSLGEDISSFFSRHLFFVLVIICYIKIKTVEFFVFIVKTDVSLKNVTF